MAPARTCDDDTDTPPEKAACPSRKMPPRRVSRGGTVVLCSTEDDDDAFDTAVLPSVGKAKPKAKKKAGKKKVAAKKRYGKIGEVEVEMQADADDDEQGQEEDGAAPAAEDLEEGVPMPSRRKGRGGQVRSSRESTSSAAQMTPSLPDGPWRASRGPWAFSRCWPRSSASGQNEVCSATQSLVRV